MKKLIIALMGLFMLVACSEDSVQNTEPAASEISNSVKTVDTTIRYESPYGTADRFEYVFQNDTDFEWHFVAWVQLCFYDGINDNVHFGHNLASFNYFSTFMVWPNWNEYTAQYGTKMFIIPPHTTETIFMNNGKVLPVDPAGPTTASGQYFDLETPNMGPMKQNEMDFFGKYLKFVGFEGGVYYPGAGNVTNTTLRFPLGPQFSNSAVGVNAIWQPVNVSWSPFDQKIFNVNSKEIGITNAVSGGSIGGRPSFINFTANGNSYTCSAYTTKDKVVVVLE